MRFLLVIVFLIMAETLTAAIGNVHLGESNFPSIGVSGGFCPSPNKMGEIPRYHQRMNASIAPHNMNWLLYPTEWVWQTATGEWLFTRTCSDWKVFTWRVWPEAGDSKGIYNRQERLAVPVFPPGFRHWWEPRPQEDIDAEIVEWARGRRALSKHARL